ncbi:hypothetical protein M1558_00115 [Candidatus Parvarchaeota archaeon]|nr:hypothetical protein [Candidatus Parvarchaeota archaeon]
MEEKIISTSKRGVFDFVIGLVSGFSALIAGFITIFSNLSIINFSASSLSKLNVSNSTIYHSLLTIESAALDLKSSILVLGPLLIIAGIFILLLSFYLNKKISKGLEIFLMSFFTVFVFLAILGFLPFNPIAVSLIFVYLTPIGVNSLGGAADLAGTLTYVFFLLYVIFGIIKVLILSSKAIKD